MGRINVTKTAVGWLSERDERLGAYIARKGLISREIPDDLFEGLCYNIVNQQLSMKACDTLWGKLMDSCGTATPDTMCDSVRLKECGLSRSKAECIARCAELFRNGSLSATSLEQMSDKEVSDTLTRIKGIGAWTAEMTLIFCLERQNVLSLSDYGIRRGLSLLHGMDINDRKAMEVYREIYSPYGTTASLYLWEISAENINGDEL